MAIVQEPTTQWFGDGEGEYNQSGVMILDDALGNLLVDAAGNTLVDSGSTFSAAPATIWTNSPGIQ